MCEDARMLGRLRRGAVWCGAASRLGLATFTRAREHCWKFSSPSRSQAAPVVVGTPSCLPSVLLSVAIHPARRLACSTRRRHTRSTGSSWLPLSSCSVHRYPRAPGTHCAKAASFEPSTVVVLCVPGPSAASSPRLDSSRCCSCRRTSSSPSQRRCISATHSRAAILRGRTLSPIPDAPRRRQP